MRRGYSQFLYNCVTTIAGEFDPHNALMVKAVLHKRKFYDAALLRGVRQCRSELGYGEFCRFWEKICQEGYSRNHLRATNEVNFRAVRELVDERKTTLDRPVVFGGDEVLLITDAT